jgi:hypothetical protein
MSAILPQLRTSTGYMPALAALLCSVGMLPGLSPVFYTAAHWCIFTGFMAQALDSVPKRSGRFLVCLAAGVALNPFLKLHVVTDAWQVVCACTLPAMVYLTFTTQHEPRDARISHP